MKVNTKNKKCVNNSYLLKKDPDVRIYTTATHGGLWLLYLFEVPFWLTQELKSEDMSHHNQIHMEIVLLPTRIHQLFPTPYYFNQTFRNTFRQLYKIIRNTSPDLSTEKSDNKSVSIYDRIYSGEKVNFQFGQFSLTFRLYNSLSLQCGLPYLKSIIKSTYYWLKCYRGGHFIIQKLLNLKYHNIQIGDLVASITLRNKPHLAGSLKPCSELFLNLASAICICDLCDRVSLEKEKNKYVLVPEQTYLNNIYERMLHELGTSIIEPLLYYQKYKIIPPDQVYTNPCIIRSSVNRELSPVEINRVHDYMDIRLSNIGQIMYCMDEGQNDNSSNGIVDIYGNIIDLSRQRLYVLLFLHAFEDSQYHFGTDGFDDLYHWTTFTIDQCLNNDSIDMILIKQHPAVNYKLYHGDKAAYDNLIRRYLGNTKVIFIGKNSSLVYLAKNYHLFGITHHGSIAEELVYLGQPIIASSYAPWQSNYCFVKTWKNIKEYSYILHSLSVEMWSPPSDIELSSLYAYILEYRLNDYTVKCRSEKKSSWFQFAKLYFKDDLFEFTQENGEIIEGILKKMNREDQIFKDYIELLSNSYISSYY